MFNMFGKSGSARFATAAALSALFALTGTVSAKADPLALIFGGQQQRAAFTNAYAYAAPAMPAIEEEETTSAETPAHLKRQIVSYAGREAAGTIIVDTPNTYLYYVLGNGKAVRYGIGVGREGFTWSGTQSVTKKAEWPDWTPPAEMVQRQPYLPRFMSGGPGNPLGARAMYLGGTIYRIHGTNNPSTIGQRVSSGCIRLTNDDVADLYSRVTVGTKVVVLPMTTRTASR
jgi:lipoprotein-anchoring transpeptidase ErfK/SrfK